MANWTDPQLGAAQPTITTVGRDVAFDAGLRSHMLSVYNYMASGVLLTGVVAYLFAYSGMAFEVFVGGGLLRWVLIFAPLLMVFGLNFAFERMSHGALQVFFWAFAVVMGLSMGLIPLIYTGASIATVFFATAAAFVSLSLWGYTTKRDLTGFGTFLLMGLVGLFVVMIGNALFGSAGRDTLDIVISVFGVLIFAGLTAYDTQKIKSIYFQVAGSDMLGKAAILGALTLYLDFINMFTFLLNLMGSRE